MQIELIKDEEKDICLNGLVFSFKNWRYWKNTIKNNVMENLLSDYLDYCAQYIDITNLDYEIDYYTDYGNGFIRHINVFYFVLGKTVFSFYFWFFEFKDKIVFEDKRNIYFIFFKKANEKIEIEIKSILKQENEFIFFKYFED